MDLLVGFLAIISILMSSTTYFRLHKLARMVQEFIDSANDIFKANISSLDMHARRLDQLESSTDAEELRQEVARLSVDIKDRLNARLTRLELETKSHGEGLEFLVNAVRFIEKFEETLKSHGKALNKARAALIQHGMLMEKEDQ